ncbi:MAG: cytochrome P460 family protein [Alphaproteobacteria bacterium]|nr:cytochrome P460 family protein [Alphaproteobacteria bacterium]
MTRLLVLFPVLCLVAACADGTDPDATLDVDAFAADLWDDAVGAYPGWSQRGAWTTTPVPSQSHAGDHVVAWYDDAMIAWDLQGTAPDGATAVKVHYDSATATEPKAYTVMTKVDGFDAEHGDWFWARYEADGSVTVAGSVGACTGCHGAVSDTSDWVYGEPPA